MRLIVACLLGTAGFAVSHFLLGSEALARPQAAPRATSDRPDELGGPQLHVIYAIPADGNDRRLDTDGTLEASVRSFEDWLAQQTGGRALRLDTSGGQIDVTFVRLGKTDGEIAARGAYVRDQLESDLLTAGQIQSGKVYAVYYDGTSTYACGGGAWPPSLPGRVAAMYLKGRYGSVNCSLNRFASPGGQPGYMEWAMLHEVLHTLGFVPTCATNHTRAGHVPTPSDDLMYAGDEPWRFPVRLDPDREDYYGHGRSDCANLARSEYLATWPQDQPAAATTAATTTAAKPVTTTKAKAKPTPKCKRGQKSTKRKPCRR